MTTTEKTYVRVCHNSNAAIKTALRAGNYSNYNGHKYMLTTNFDLKI